MAHNIFKPVDSFDLYSIMHTTKDFFFNECIHVLIMLFSEEMIIITYFWLTTLLLDGKINQFFNWPCRSQKFHMEFFSRYSVFKTFQLIDYNYLYNKIVVFELLPYNGSHYKRYVYLFRIRIQLRQSFNE